MFRICGQWPRYNLLYDEYHEKVKNIFHRNVNFELNIQKISMKGPTCPQKHILVSEFPYYRLFRPLVQKS